MTDVDVPFDTSGLNEATTGVHSFGGGSKLTGKVIPRRASASTGIFLWFRSGASPSGSLPAGEANHLSRLDCLLPFQSGDDCSQTVISARAERLVSRQDARPAIKMGAADGATKSRRCTPRRTGSIADYLPNVSAESGGASCQIMKSSPAFRFFATRFFGCRRSVPPAARTEFTPIRVMKQYQRLVS